MQGITYLNEGWEFIETRLDKPKAVIGYSDAEWLSAVVPGNVHLDLMEHGVIPNPHERMYEMGVQWVDETDWSYRCIFEWQNDEDLPNKLIHFEGLDTVCTVSLNGEKIAEHDNMFVPLKVDVSGLLLDGENELRVDFKSALNVGRERKAAYFKAEGMSENVERFDERSFVRKIQCMYGWDWGPRLVSCGVFRPVQIIEYSTRIASLSARQDWNPDGSVTLTALCAIEGDDETVEFELTDPFDAETIVSEDGVFKIENPMLWWPAGSGGQPLYTLTATAGEVSKTIKIGLRTVKLLREKDEIGESFEFEVNGEKIYCKGFNWIPDWSFPGALTRTRISERVEQAADLGSNMLRIWGGGTYESDDFYDVCDEIGILVWQDFMHACAYYPDTGEWLDVAKTEATSNIERLRHHASLALWCGNNENLTMWQGKWNWFGHPQPPRFYGSNLYDGVYPELVAALDPERSYIHTSPCGDIEGDCNAGKVGDSHYWDAWHGRGDWKYYLDSEARFSSEYGFASSCSLALWEDTLALEDWDYQSPAVRWHDKTRKGYETFVGYAELHYPKSESLEDWVYYSQLNQRDALRMGVEHFRRNAFCRGSLIWQLNDIWPVQSWAVIDSSGRYKAAAHEIGRRLYNNEILSLERVKDKVKVHFVSDELGEGSELTTVYAQAIHIETGEVLNNWESEFEAGPGLREVVAELELTGFATPDTLITAWTDAGHTPVWHLLDEPKNMRWGSANPILGSTMEPDTLHRNDGPYFAIALDGPVVDLMLSVDGDTSVFMENFITVASGGVVEIPVTEPITHFEARSLAGHHETRMTRSPL